MNHTFFHDQHGDIIRNRTESYYPYQNGYRQYIKVFDMVGDGGLITDLNDLVRWDNAFYNEKLGIRDFAEKLSRRYTLSNGSTIPYAWGINNDTYKGLRTLEHGGFMLAYDSDILRFPDQHFTVIVLNNARGRRWTTSLAYTIADMYLLAYETPITRKTVTVKTIPSNNKSEKQLAGHYWNINYNYYNEIKFENDTLYFDNTDGWKAVLHHIGKNSYQITGSEIRLFFNGDTMKMRDPASKNPDEEFRKYDPMPPINISEIIPYAGTYYSEELETYYYLKIQGNTATLTINRRPPIQIFPATGNFIWNSKTKIWISIGEITFLKDGLLIGDNRVKGVYFKKLN
jgi:hypothetical protein